MIEENYGENNKKIRWIPFAIFVVVILGVLGGLFFWPGNEVRFPAGTTTGCVVMQDGGDYSNSVNIVFLGTEYGEDIDQFRLDSENFMSSFFGVVPHDKYKTRFNFFRMETFGDYGCKYDDAVVCNPQLVQKEAVNCPGQDISVVLVSRDKVNNFFRHLRSSAWMSTISLNAADDPLVFPHEAAHIIYDFADEYEYGGKITWDAPNCDSDYLTCPKFSVVEGSECHVGCVNSENSRSVFYSIMSNYWKSDSYGIYNEWYIENFLLDNTKDSNGNIETEGSPKRSPEMVYIITGNCDINGECELDDAKFSPVLGYATSSKLVDSSLKIEHGDYSVSIPKEAILFKDFGPEGSMEVKEYSFSVAVPVDEKDNKILLVVDDKIEDAIILESEEIQRTGYSKVVKILGVS